MDPLRLTAWRHVVVACTVIALMCAPVAAQAAQADALPVALPASPAAGSTQHLVFAHYFTPYPISFSNTSWVSDYYANGYINPQGEGGVHAPYGGFLRERPLPRDPIATSYQLEDMKTEVRRASAAGLDGFTVDLLSASGTHFDRVNQLLAAAHAVNPTFRIVLMPDMTAGFGSLSNAAFAQSIAGMASSPAAFHLPDGRLVLSPFYAEKQTPAWWTATFNILQAQYGIRVAFVPCFLNFPGNKTAFAPISYGFSNWGNRSPATNTNAAADAATAHGLGKIWMQPVSAQDERPRSHVWDEAGNTENLRVTWNAAISGNADWVQIPTWNDYSEGAEIAPSSHIGWAYLDLMSYYAARYHSGAWPAVRRDVLVVTHRTQFANATTTFAETSPMTLRAGSSAPRDEVEVFSFLTAAGSVTARVGGVTTTWDAPAGGFVKRLNLHYGTVSATAARAGVTVATVTSPYEVVEHPYVQDLQYHGAVSSRPTDISMVAPVPAIAAPAAMSNVSGNVAVTATATDTDAVRAVSLAVDGVTVATKTASPWSFTWNSAGAAAGTHTITITATDAENNSSTASRIVTTGGAVARVPVAADFSGWVYVSAGVRTVIDGWQWINGAWSYAAIPNHASVYTVPFPGSTTWRWAWYNNSWNAVHATDLAMNNV